jgi:D-alanyl-D-alanine carboxypeptidase
MRSTTWGRRSAAACVAASALTATLAVTAHAEGATTPAATTPAATGAPTPSQSPAPSTVAPSTSAPTTTAPSPTSSVPPTTGPSRTTGTPWKTPSTTWAPAKPSGSTTSFPSTELPSGGGGGGGNYNANPLTPGQLAAQVAEAERIWAALTASNSTLGPAMKEMDALSKKSNGLLESLSKARDTEAAATKEAHEAWAEFVVLKRRLDAARKLTRQWAFSVYSEGGSNAEVLAMLNAMANDPERAGNPVGDLSYLTDERFRSLRDVQTIAVEQMNVTNKLESAKKTAAAATATITREKAELDKVIAVQKTKLEALKKLQAEEIQKAGPVAAYLVGASTPEAKAAAAKLQEALQASGASVFTAGKPCSGDEASYPNGMIPASGLCPLWQAPGESLRPRAAAAFNALSQEYARQTGSPICVTDSYRSLGEQYAVKASRGMWAATPGTSKHGLGMAVDLCGGINSFGTPAHLWMRQNAPLFGWFHPAWAEPGGALPEPWHWEFAG